MTKGKLVDIQGEIGFGDMMETADNPTLEQRPEAIQVGGMDYPTDIFPFPMLDSLVRIACFLQ